MAENKPYTVRNIRPRKLVMLFGRPLAPRIKGGKSEMDLTEEEFFSDQVQRRLDLSHIEVARQPEEAPPEVLTQDLSPEAPSLEPLSPSSEETPPPEVEEPPATPSSEGVKTWSFDELKALPYQEVRSVAKSLGLKANGKEDQIIQRILDDQGEE